MRNIRLFTLALAIFGAASVQAKDRQALPEFTTDASQYWFNSEPLRVSELRGQVLLIDVWTYDCWNCYRSFPWLNALEARLSDRPFRVIGIHSPEFEHEHDPARVAAKVREFGLRHPVMMDNDFAYWRALGNRYWPAYYLVDKRGMIRYRHIGETHSGDARAERIEEQIQVLLAE